MLYYTHKKILVSVDILFAEGNYRSWSQGKKRKDTIGKKKTSMVHTMHHIGLQPYLIKERYLSPKYVLHQNINSLSREKKLLHQNKQKMTIFTQSYSFLVMLSSLFFWHMNSFFFWLVVIKCILTQ